MQSPSRTHCSPKYGDAALSSGGLVCASGCGARPRIAAEGQPALLAADQVQPLAIVSNELLVSVADGSALEGQRVVYRSNPIKLR